MPDLILEIGIEEMPAGAIAAALEQWKSAAAKALEEARLPAAGVEVCGTPRRLILSATGLPARQPDVDREARGPAKSVAFGPDGSPTGAAIGFARKQGVAVEHLEIVSTPQGEYVLARFTEQGRAAADVLGPLLEKTVTGLYFPKLMLWGGGALRFVRPVRWIVSLLDDQVVPMEIGGVRSGARSRGHRFLAPDEFEVPQSARLLEQLRAACVLTDPDERRSLIREQADALAESAGGRIPWDEGLLDENVWLVEWPTAVLGSFDEQYLSLPRPVLVTAMKKHQRYFPVEGSDGTLQPHFVAVRSGGADHLDIVREGYERVLTARFSDAAFFHGLDQKSSLEEMAGQLGRLIFQERLGTMADKRARLQILAADFGRLFGLGPDETADLSRAASLCKADLVSRMVVELPALQGIMGREYAISEGERTEVADAIGEHYQPRSAGDATPASKLGRLLALADRIDTLTGYVGIGVMPSGSSDPFGLRRAAQGVVQILAEDGDAPSPLALAAAASKAYQQVNGLDLSDDLYNNLRTLFLQRLNATLEERGVRYDLADAALAATGPYALVVHDAIARASELANVVTDERFVPTVQVGARISNILKASGLAESLKPASEPRPDGAAALVALERGLALVDPGLFTESSERALMDAVWNARGPVSESAARSEYWRLFEVLQSVNGPVDRFFDDVMVMVDEPAVRENRLALLRGVEALYRTLADWTRVVVA